MQVCINWTVNLRIMRFLYNRIIRKKSDRTWGVKSIIPQTYKILFILAIQIMFIVHVFYIELFRQLYHKYCQYEPQRIPFTFTSFSVIFTTEIVVFRFVIKCIVLGFKKTRSLQLNTHVYVNAYTHISEIVPSWFVL